MFGGTFVVVETVYELLLARMAHGIAPRLGRYGRRVNRATGGVFIGLGAALASTQR